ncbi:MAG: hypothetical protein QXO32_00360 [Candidatus Bathyarchaeia archaeon]
MAGVGEVETNERAIHKPTIIPEDLDAVRSVIIGCGALEKAKNRSRRHGEIAKKLLAKTSHTEEVKGLFSSLIDYLMESFTWYR